MSSTLIVILFAIGFVALFVLGMSLTLIFKGHNIKSEIGDNEHMKARGITCTLASADAERPSGDGCPSQGGCHQCDTNKKNCL